MKDVEKYIKIRIEEIYKIKAVDLFYEDGVMNIKDENGNIYVIGKSLENSLRFEYASLTGDIEGSGVDLVRMVLWGD